MIILKVRQSWLFVGATRLLRALLLYGAAYYFALALAFGLHILASMSSEVGNLHLDRVRLTLTRGIQLYYPIVDTKCVRTLEVTSYPDHTNSFVIFVGVVACNHLMLSLREEALEHPTSMGLLPPLPPRTMDVVFPPQAPGVTHTYSDRSQNIPLYKRGASTAWNDEQVNMRRTQVTWHEM
jgi:hypothetical protein